MLGIRKRGDRPRPTSYVRLDHRYGEDYGFSVLEVPNGAEEGGEPLRNWYFWSRKVGAVLRLASSLDQHSYGTSRDWAELYGDTYGPPPTGYKPLPGITHEDVMIETRATVYEEVACRLTLAGVSIEINGWEKRLWIRTPTLFSGLMLQLAAAICGCDGFSICSMCNMPYTPRRQPTIGRNNYCGNCGRTAAVRHAARRFRQRRKQEIEDVSLVTSAPATAASVVRNSE